MIATLAAILVATPQVVVDRIPGSSEIALVATFNVPGYLESPENHGYRHLIEHLMAKGNSGVQDVAFERQGIFLGASTDRETVTFRLLGKAGQEVAMVEALRRLLAWSKPTDADIQAEVDILEQELFLVDPKVPLITAGRGLAYGDRWLSPHGSLPALRGATASTVYEFFQRWFTATNLTLSAFGAVNQADLTIELEKLYESLPEGPSVPSRPQRTADSGRVEAKGVRGESITAACGSVLDSLTWAQLAAMLTIASRVPDAFVSFAADPFECWVTIGRVGAPSGIGLAADAFDDADAVDHFLAAKSWAKQWIQSQAADPLLAATLMGRLGAAVPPITVDMMLESAEAMTFNEYRLALSRLRGEASYRVVGGG